MKPETFSLPWPNSDNNHHIPVAVRSKRFNGHVGKIVLSKDAASYRALVKMLLGIRSDKRRWSCPLDISIDLFPPRRGCDTTNYWKSLCDALTHAGVWDDDVLVVEARARRHDPVGKKKSSVTVLIEEHKGEQDGTGT